MSRSCFKVTPTSEVFPLQPIPPALKSLHKLEGTFNGWSEVLNPFCSSAPTFEFLAISAGDTEPVEFYYSTDTDHNMDTLHQRLDRIYPETFDIEPTTLDLGHHLLEPIAYSASEFTDRLNAGDVHYEITGEEGPAVDATVSGPQSETETLTIPQSDQPHLVTNGGLDGGGINPLVLNTEDGTVTLDPPNAIPNNRALTTLDKPTALDTDTVLARPPADEITPVGVRWTARAMRKKDWMTQLTPFDHATATETDPRLHTPLVDVIDSLTAARHPIAFQVVIKRKKDWMRKADIRTQTLRRGEETLGGKIGNELSRQLSDEFDPTDRELSGTMNDRIEQIETNDPTRTFRVNIRAIALPVDQDAYANLAQTMDALCSVLDPLDGQFYHLDGQCVHHRGLTHRVSVDHAHRERERLFNRTLETGGSKRKRPDIVMNADELANVFVIPSGADLSVEGSRGTRAEQQSRNPLPRPDPDTRQAYDTGLVAGLALDENRVPEADPMCIPPELLTFHVGRFAKSGAGKSIALDNDGLSVYDQTDGPVIIIDQKGGGLPENYMRAHAKHFGFDDLEENVLHFNIPDILPGFAFFNIEPRLAHADTDDEHARLKAIQDTAEHYEEILKMVMGTEQYDRAVVASNLIPQFIRLMYDDEFGLEHGHYRESINYFSQTQLEQVIDQYHRAGPPQPTPEDAPRLSDTQLTAKLHRHLHGDPNTFANIISGVSNRLDYITTDPFLRRIFDTTEPRFDFREILDDQKVIIFDLGDLRHESAKVMAGVILTSLYDAAKTRDGEELAQLSEDYVINLLIDEAASVTVSEVLTELLEQGREFRMSVELATQFPEQFEHEGDKQVYLDVLNNISTRLVGNISVDQEIAEALAHEEMDPTEFRNRIRALPRGEWIAQFPSPEFRETAPLPFSMAPLPIPEGHPESDQPLTDTEERRFQQALETVHERTQTEYGVPERPETSTARSPEAVQEHLDIESDELDVALARVIRIIQLREGVHEENDWVAVEDVDAELRAIFADSDVEPPAYDVLTDIRERSRLIEVDIETDRDVLIVRLTAAGKEKAIPETGDVRAAGHTTHDDALFDIEEHLTELGFRVVILEQDGSEQPDARATHPEIEQTIVIEAETTTPENPVKILANLKRAHEEDTIPLFVVRPGDTKTYWAERVEGILSPPVRQLADGETRFYTHDRNITFNGGATAEGGATAVRSADDGSHQTVWIAADEDLVLSDGTGTEYARVSSMADTSKERFPAIYSYDQANDEYVVYEHGEQHVYDTSGAFEADWARIKKPFVPEDELPSPAVDHDSYEIVIVPKDGEAMPVVYEDGTTQPLSVLLESPSDRTTVAGNTERTAPGTSDHEDDRAASDGTHQPDRAESDGNTPSEGQSSESSADEIAFGTFIDNCISEDADAVTPKDDLYDAYRVWAIKHEQEVKSKAWFSRSLGEAVAFETSRIRRDGERVNCYTGLQLTAAGQTLIE